MLFPACGYFANLAIAFAVARLLNYPTAALYSSIRLLVASSLGTSIPAFTLVIFTCYMEYY